MFFDGPRPRSPIFVNAGAVKRRADVFAQIREQCGCIVTETSGRRYMTIDRDEGNFCHGALKKYVFDEYGLSVLYTNRNINMAHAAIAIPLAVGVNRS